MAKYGKKASEKVEKALHERKKGKLKSGRSGKKVTSKKQAIAIGLSQARKAGAKVPRKKTSKSRCCSPAFLKLIVVNMSKLRSVLLVWLIASITCRINSRVENSSGWRLRGQSSLTRA